MASKFGLAGGIPERRVRPIWDAVDSRQFKAALKLSVALLAKFPRNPYALALKALILERMGKPDEALSVCLNAKELIYSDTVTLIDDLTLSTLQMVFQRLDRLDLATSCYEHVCGKCPNNLEMMMGLFNCYVREYSYVKQQQTAIKMYKIVGEERFLLWAVCSIQLQVFCTGGGEKLLSLAEALLKKHISSHSLHDPEALAVYISILEQQAKYQLALELLSGNLGALIGREEDKLRMQGKLLARACDYAAAAEIFQKVLESCPDDWESFLHYLGCLLEDDMNWSKANTADHEWLPCAVNSQKKNKLTEEVFESRLSHASSLVQKLQERSLDNAARGPYLAGIEIERRRRLNGNADAGKLMQELMNYFHRFGHMPCFASDVEGYLWILTENEKDELLEKVVRTSETSSASPVSKIGLAITIFKVHGHLGATSTQSIKEVEATVVKMVEMFYKNLPLSMNLDPQENLHGEDLLSMASNILVLLFWRTRKLGYLLEAVMVLEFGLTIQRHVWPYKILLLHLYSYLGALPLAYEWYGTLEVKNILLETVSHHILPQLLTSPFFLEASDLVKDHLKFMDDHLKEAADLACLAYRHRNYSKVIEFVQFKERLQHSIQYLMSKLDSCILQMKQKADSLEEIEGVLESVNCGSKLLELSNEDNLKSLTFNEDLQARPWWTPTKRVNFLSEPYEEGSALECFKAKLSKDKASEMEGIERKHVERKSLLPRLLYLSLQAASSAIKDNIERNGTVSDSVAGEIKLLLEKYARNMNLSVDDAIGMILAISNGQKSFKNLSSDLISWMDFAVFVNAWSLCSSRSLFHDSDGNCPNSWHIMDNLVKTCIEELLSHAEPMSASPESNIPILVQLVTEPFSWHIVVIQSCIRSMLPVGKKKKKGSAVDHSNSPQLHAIHSSIQCLSSAIQEISKWLAGRFKGSEEQDLDTLLSCVQGTDDHGEDPGQVLRILEKNVAADRGEMGRISQSLQSWSSTELLRRIVGAHRKSLLELSKICESRLKLLESLMQSTWT